MAGQPACLTAQRADAPGPPAPAHTVANQPGQTENSFCKKATQGGWWHGGLYAPRTLSDLLVASRLHLPMSHSGRPLQRRQVTFLPWQVTCSHCRFAPGGIALARRWLSGGQW